MSQAEVLRGLRAIGPCTSGELAKYIYGDRFDCYSAANTAGTLRRLLKQGYVAKIGTTIGGNYRIVPLWDVVE